MRYPVEVRYFIYTFFSFFLGMCEALWQPDMNTEEIFECIAQALTNALDRDASSGWGAVVHIIEAERITTKKIKTRMD
jgi:20S proteasome subunit beta 3